jgi:hypothetical protein
MDKEVASDIVFTDHKVIQTLAGVDVVRCFLAALKVELAVARKILTSANKKLFKAEHIDPCIRALIDRELFDVAESFVKYAVSEKIFTISYFVQWVNLFMGKKEWMDASTVISDAIEQGVFTNADADRALIVGWITALIKERHAIEAKTVWDAAILKEILLPEDVYTIIQEANRCYAIDWSMTIVTEFLKKHPRARVHPKEEKAWVHILDTVPMKFRRTAVSRHAYVIFLLASGEIERLSSAIMLKHASYIAYRKHKGRAVRPVKLPSQRDPKALPALSALYRIPWPQFCELLDEGSNYRKAHSDPVGFAKMMAGKAKDTSVSETPAEEQVDDETLFDARQTLDSRRVAVFLGSVAPLLVGAKGFALPSPVNQIVFALLLIIAIWQAMCLMAPWLNLAPAVPAAVGVSGNSKIPGAWSYRADTTIGNSSRFGRANLVNAMAGEAEGIKTNKLADCVTNRLFGH